MEWEEGRGKVEVMLDLDDTSSRPKLLTTGCIAHKVQYKQPDAHFVMEHRE